jgi:tRNA-dihydrouridine synthase B
MAGVSDLPFRVIARSMGAVLVTTEMVSGRGLFFKNEKTQEMLRIDKTEHPAALQIFGNDPDIMAMAAQAAEKAGADAVDINMGCPMQKVVKNGDGSALMRDLPLAESVIRAAAHAVSVPVTVKMRLGWDRSSLNAAELAAAAEEAGAAAVTVHGRTREEFYSGHADWSEIRRVVESVHIPVWGNGDVTDGPSAKALMEETGCCGVMIGRAAWGNPWIFRQINAYLEMGIEIPGPSRRERMDMAVYHLRALADMKGEWAAVREMRAHACRYFHGLPRAAALRRGVMRAQSVDQFCHILEEYAAEEGGIL